MMPIIGQLRGTEYAVAEIVWWMLAAALVGLAIGWLLRGFRTAQEVEAEYQPRLEAAEEKLTESADERERLASDLDAAQQRLGEVEEALRIEKQRNTSLAMAIEQQTAADLAENATQESLFAGPSDPLPEEER